MANRYWVGGGSTADWNATGNTNWSETSGGANNASVPTSSDSVFFDSNSPACTLSSNKTVASFDCDGYTDTFTHNAGITLTITGAGVGSVCRFSSGMTYTKGNATTSALAFTTGGSGGVDLTTNGKVLGNISISGATWALTLLDDLESSGAITFSAGVFNQNNKNIKCLSFSTSTSSAKIFNSGSAISSLDGASALSVQGGTAGSGETAQQRGQSFTTINTQIKGVVLRLQSNGTPTDDLIVSIYDSLGGTELASKSIPSASLSTGTLNFFEFDDVLEVTSATTYFIVVSRSGARDTSNYWSIIGRVTTGGYSGGTARIRSSNTWQELASNDTSFVVVCESTPSTIELTSTGTVWNLGTTTGIRGFITDDTTIKFTNNSSSSKTFDGGGLTYHNFWNATQGTGSVQISDSNTFNEIKIDAGRTQIFEAGTTQTTESFDAIGTSGNLIVIDSSTTGTHNLVKSGGGYIVCDYLDVQHSVATPANSWYAGDNSVNDQAVSSAGSGWEFLTPTADNFYMSGSRGVTNVWSDWFEPATITPSGSVTNPNNAKVEDGSYSESAFVADTLVFLEGWNSGEEPTESLASQGSPAFYTFDNGATSPDLSTDDIFAGITVRIEDWEFFNWTIVASDFNIDLSGIVSLNAVEVRVKYYTNAGVIYIDTIQIRFNYDFPQYLDQQSVWSNEANSIDGSTSTYATPSGASGDSGITNGLFLFGSNASSLGDILQVRARVYGQSEGMSIHADIYDETFSELLGSTEISSATPAWGSYVTLVPPTGGWTEQGVQDLIAICYESDASALATSRLYVVELEVTHESPSEQLTYTVDSIVKDTVLKTHTADTIVKDTIEKGLTVDLYSVLQLSESHTIDTGVVEPILITSTSDTIVKETESIAHTVDFPVEVLNENDVTVDTIVQDTYEIQHTIDSDVALYAEQLSVFIDGVDKTDQVLFPTLRINEYVNQQVDTAYFKSRKYKPELGSDIYVTFKGEKIFGGFIVRVETQHEAQTQIYSVECKDYSQLLGRKLVLERFENQTINAIIEAILTEYAPDFSDEFVDCDTVIKSISFNRITVMECIDRLSEIVNYSWYVDYDKKIHFIAQNDEPAPFNLGEMEENHIWNSLELEEDFSQIRNQVYVLGGEFEGDERTESYIADGTQEQFPLAYKFSSKPTVEVNSVVQTVGLDGINSEDDFDCFWNFTGKYIRFNTASTPALDDVLEVTGIPLLPIIVRVSAPSSILENGVYEHKIEDSTISSRDDATERARVELEAYKNSIRQGSFSTYRSGLKAGQTININIGSTNEDFIIQSISFNMRTIDEGIWNVEIATTRAIGIVNFLQKLLRTNKQIDDTEILLNFESFADSLEITETLTLPSETRTGDYLWADASDPADEGNWNFATWD